MGLIAPHSDGTPFTAIEVDANSLYLKSLVTGPIDSSSNPTEEAIKTLALGEGNTVKVSVTSDILCTNTNQVNLVLADATDAALTVVLPASGIEYMVAKIDAGANAVSIHDAAFFNAALLLANELRSDYTSHINSYGATAGEHKALHNALAAPIAITAASLITLTNDLSAKYVLHNADAILADPIDHIAQATTHALASETAVTTVAGAVTRLLDLKAKYNLHDADSAGHRTGGLFVVAAAQPAGLSATLSAQNKLYTYLWTGLSWLQIASV